MLINSKIKISQQEINEIYEITKEEPFPQVTEVTPKEELKELTEQEWEDKLDTDCGAISEEQYNENKNEEQEQ